MMWYIMIRTIYTILWWICGMMLCDVTIVIPSDVITYFIWLVGKACGTNMMWLWYIIIVYGYDIYYFDII